MACVPAALALIYASLFGMGALLFGQYAAAAIYLGVAVVGAVFIWRMWPGLFEPEAMLEVKPSEEGE